MEKSNKVAILSLSGGMDSTCLLIKLLAEGYKEVHCITFEYGQTHKVEVGCAIETCVSLQLKNFPIHHKTYTLPFMRDFESSLTNKDLEVPEGHYEEESMKSTVVPNRNMIFSSIIFGAALSLYKKTGVEVDICLGVHSGDHAIYPDCTEEFRDKVEEAFRVGNWDSDKVSVYVPYIKGNKTTILQDCLENCKKLNLDFDSILSNTITSYNPDILGRSSGKSGSDIERIEAFINIGRKDPIKYQRSWEVIVEEVTNLLKSK